MIAKKPSARYPNYESLIRDLEDVEKRGTFTVQRIIPGEEGETTETIPVTVGLRDGQFSEILSGLEPGDALLIGNDIPRIQFGPPDDEA